MMQNEHVNDQESAQKAMIRTMMRAHIMEKKRKGTGELNSKDFLMSRRISRSPFEPKVNEIGVKNKIVLS